MPDRGECVTADDDDWGELEYLRPVALAIDAVFAGVPPDDAAEAVPEAVREEFWAWLPYRHVIREIAQGPPPAAQAGEGD